MDKGTEVKIKALFTLHKLTWVRPGLELTQVRPSFVYTASCTLDSVNTNLGRTWVSLDARMRSGAVMSRFIVSQKHKWPTVTITREISLGEFISPEKSFSLS